MHTYKSAAWHMDWMEVGRSFDSDSLDFSFYVDYDDDGTITLDVEDVIILRDQLNSFLERG